MMLLIIMLGFHNDGRDDCVVLGVHDDRETDFCVIRDVSDISR